MNFNLKAILDLDSKGFKEGAQESKEAADVLKDTVEDTAESISDKFGVSIKGVKDGMKAAKASLVMMSNAMKGAATATTVTSKAMKILKMALVSTGIGAIVVALGSLIAYLSSTAEGSRKLQKVLVPLKAIFGVIKSLILRLGEGMADLFTDPIGTIKKFGQMIVENVVNRFTGLLDIFGAAGRALAHLFKGDWDALSKDVGDAADAIKQAVTGLTKEQREAFADTVVAAYKEEEAAAKEALKLEEDRLAARMAISRLELEQSKYKRIVDDELGHSAEERLEAAKKGLAIEEQIGGKKTSIAKREYDLAVQRNIQENGNLVLTDDIVSLYEELLSVQKDVNERAGEWNGKLKTATDQLTAQVEKVRAIKDGISKVDNSAIAKPSATIGDDDASPDGLPSINVVEAYADRFQTSIDKMKKASLDLSSTVNSAISGLASDFGEFVGGLVTGEADFKSFAKVIAGSFGDMAVQVGKIAIETGVATLGIKAALESLNPWVAIAAGVALVALGTAVKGAMSNVAENWGGSSAAASIAGGGSLDLTAGSMPEGSSGNIEVTGELVLSGDNLVAALRRKEYTDSLKF